MIHISFIQSVTADFGGFREVKHLLIIFSLYRFEFIKILIFTVFEMLNFVCLLTKQHLQEVLIFFNWKKSAAEAYRMLVKVYGDTAPIDKSCRKWFRRFKDGDFSNLQISLALDSQKNSKTKNSRHYSKKIRVKRKRSLQNHWGNSISPFCTIENHRNDSTRKLGALWTKTETLKGDFLLANSWFKNREKVFYIGLWLEMRSGYSTTLRRKNTTLSLVNCCHRPQHQHHDRTFMVRKSWSVSGGTKKVLFTMCCWNLTIPLWVIGIDYNWFVWAVHCRNTSKDMIKLFFFMTTLGHMSLKS